MDKTRFSELELPEEIYPQYSEDEPHPLKDEEWLFEVGNYLDRIAGATKDLKSEIKYLTSETRIISRFTYLKRLLRDYGSHQLDCKALTIEVPNFGEERRLCTCGWCELKFKLKHKRRY